MDPDRRDAMRQSFIATVKQIDPIDALVLKAVRDNGPAQFIPPAPDALGIKFKCSRGDITVSIENLAELSCVGPSAPSFDQPRMKPFGTLLMNVVSD
jgi:hypothetical protein